MQIVYKFKNHIKHNIYYHAFVIMQKTAGIS